MRTAALVVVWVAFAAASTVRFAAVPRSITLPATGASLRTSEIAQLNEVLLGLSTKPVTTFPVETELFSAPRALAVIDVAGVDDLNVKGQSYGVDVDGYDMVSLEGSVALNFGADRETVAVNGKGATGSQLAQTVAETTVDETLVKTKFEPLRSELIQVYKLVAALNSQAAKLSKTSSPDIFRVSIRGLLSITGSADEINMASHEVQKAVDALTSTLNNAYGGQAIVEVICESRAVQDKENTTEHRITKRDVAVSDTQKLRNMYNVSVFTSPDYPAIFAIFAGLAIILAIAVLYIAVGIWNMDPGRDSIIYRMTTTRMKKD